MRARALLLVVGLLLARDASAFRCGTPRVLETAFAGGCTRPALANVLQSAQHPITVHYDPADAALAQIVLDSADYSWAFTMQTLGFEAPPTDGTLGGDARFDFYLEVSQFGGYFCPEAPTPATDRMGYSGWVSLNPQAFGAAEMPAVVAHELNHASQLGVDAYETAAFMEMTSAYVMEKVYDDVNLAAPYISFFQGSPESALDYYVYAEPYQYGASMFLFWLFDEKLGDASLSADAWDAAKQPYDPNLFDFNEPDFMDVLDDMAVARGESLDEWYLEFAADRWFTGSHDDGTFAEGETYDSVALEGSFYWDSLPSSDRLGGPVDEMGTTYIEIDGDGATRDAVFAIEHDGSTTWKVLLLRESDGSRGELSLDAEGAVTFPLTPGKNVLAVVNAGTHDPDAAFEAEDWEPADFTYRVSLVGGSGGGDGCGCTLAPAARPPLWPALFAAVLLLRRRCG